MPGRLTRVNKLRHRLRPVTSDATLGIISGHWHSHAVRRMEAQILHPINSGLAILVHARRLQLIAQRRDGLLHVAKLRLCCIERVLLLDHVK